MRLKTDWILQDPIDLEHKQYVLLDYIAKVNEDFDKFKLYPSFQELALHLASIGSIKERGQYLVLNRDPEEIDDEILLTDLNYKKLITTKENIEEILKIVDYSKDKITDLFLIGKSIYSLIYDATLLSVIHNADKIKTEKPGRGFFCFNYKGKGYVYQYFIRLLSDKSGENKCDIEKIYEGNLLSENIDEIISLVKQHHHLKDGPRYNTYEQIDKRYPIFNVKFEQEYDLEGGLISIVKRKVMNYVFQTIKIQELKNDD